MHIKEWGGTCAAAALRGRGRSWAGRGGADVGPARADAGGGRGGAEPRPGSRGGGGGEGGGGGALLGLSGPQRAAAGRARGGAWARAGRAPRPRASEAGSAPRAAAGPGGVAGGLRPSSSSAAAWFARRGGEAWNLGARAAGEDRGDKMATFPGQGRGFTASRQKPVEERPREAPDSPRCAALRRRADVSCLRGSGREGDTR